MAAYDAENEELVTVCKVSALLFFWFLGVRVRLGLGWFILTLTLFFTFIQVMSGFTDEEYKSLTTDFQASLLQSPKAYYRLGAVVPRHFFSPTEVWEIRGADITISKNHSSGFSLRFPRFIRKRPDKKPLAGATTLEQIAALYAKQEHLHRLQSS